MHKYGKLPAMGDTHVPCLIHACTMPDTHMHLATRGRSICSHMHVSIPAHTRICNVASEQYRTYIPLKLKNCLQQTPHELRICQGK